MKVIKKHSFEAVSLLTVESGVLEVAIVPAADQPDWMVPKSLILSVDDYYERIWTYLWRDQEVAVYHLVPKGQVVDKLVVLEGNTDVHRLALQTAGELSYKKVRIADVKDAALPEDIRQHMLVSISGLIGGSENQLDYLYQCVRVEGELYMVPDLDLIAHSLVDLDS